LPTGSGNLQWFSIAKTAPGDECVYLEAVRAAEESPEYRRTADEQKLLLPVAISGSFRILSGTRRALLG